MLLLAVILSSITGVVTLTDATGETLAAPGVELTLTCSDALQARRVTTSDANGRFRFAKLQSGPCTITAALQGFAPGKTDVVVRDYEALAVAIQLHAVPIESGLRVVRGSASSELPRRTSKHCECRSKK